MALVQRPAHPAPHRRRQQAASATVEEIKGYIRDQGLTPGDPLPTEAELCETLAVSRSSVREAIRTLASLDIVDVRHGYGTYVGGLSLAPLVDGLTFRGSLNQDGTFRTLREVLQVRIALDLGVAQELVEAYRDTSNDDLRQLVREMRRRSDAGELFSEQDGEFHRQLLTPLDNTIVRQLVGAFWQVHTSCVPLLGIPTSSDITDTIDAHDHMVTALEDGDADAYVEAVGRHYAPLQRAIEQALSDQDGQPAAGTHPSTGS